MAICPHLHFDRLFTTTRDVSELTGTTWFLALCVTVVTTIVLKGKDVPRRRPTRRRVVAIADDIVLIALLALIGSAGFTVLSFQGSH